MLKQKSRTKVASIKIYKFDFHATFEYYDYENANGPVK